MTLAAEAFAKPDVREPEVEEAVREELAVAEEALAEIAAGPFKAESDVSEVPAWERDPTMAELRPDLAALEQAMAFAQSNETDDELPVLNETAPAPVAKPEAPELIPEITLDNAINQRIKSALIDEPGEVSAATTSGEFPTVKIPPSKAKKADAEVEKIVAELAKAKSIEDIDDRMAETLFGEELNFVAAQVLANGPNAFSANDDHDVVAAGQPVTAGEPVESGLSVATGPPMSNGNDIDIEVTLEAPRRLDGGGIDLSASQRLKTVRALNADLHPSRRKPEPQARLRPASTENAAEESPDSIEDQITSMTQTLKALDVSPPMLEDDDDGSKGGFFSRFKRS